MMMKGVRSDEIEFFLNQVNTIFEGKMFQLKRNSAAVSSGHQTDDAKFCDTLLASNKILETQLNEIIEICKLNMKEIPKKKERPKRSSNNQRFQRSNKNDPSDIVSAPLKSENTPQKNGSSDDKQNPECRKQNNSDKPNELNSIQKQKIKQKQNNNEDNMEEIEEEMNVIPQQMNVVPQQMNGQPQQMNVQPQQMNVIPQQNQQMNVQQMQQMNENEYIIEEDGEYYDDDDYIDEDDYENDYVDNNNYQMQQLNKCNMQQQYYNGYYYNIQPHQFNQGMYIQQNSQPNFQMMMFNHQNNNNLVQPNARYLPYQQPMYITQYPMNYSNQIPINHSFQPQRQLMPQVQYPNQKQDEQSDQNKYQEQDEDVYYDQDDDEDDDNDDNEEEEEEEKKQQIPCQDNKANVKNNLPQKKRKRGQPMRNQIEQENQLLEYTKFEKKYGFQIPQFFKSTIYLHKTPRQKFIQNLSREDYFAVAKIYEALQNLQKVADLLDTSVSNVKRMLSYVKEQINQK